MGRSLWAFGPLLRRNLISQKPQIKHMRIRSRLNIWEKVLPWLRLNLRQIPMLTSPFHYAGTVSYNVTGWLEKNKDPVNDTVVDILKRSSCELMVTLWMDHPGQSAPPDDKKKKKKGGGKTV